MPAQPTSMLLAALVALASLASSDAHAQRFIGAAPGAASPRVASHGAPSWMDGGFFDLDRWWNSGRQSAPAVASAHPYAWIGDGHTSYDGWQAPLMYPDAMVCEPPASSLACPPPPVLAYSTAHEYPWSVHSNSIFAEVLYLHANGIDMAHAQQQDGIGGAGTVPINVISVADPHHDLGFRVGGTLQLDHHSSMLLSYAWYSSSVGTSVHPPNIPGGLGAVGSLIHHPGALITASVGPVHARYDIDFQTGDVSYRRSLWVEPPAPQPCVDPCGFDPNWCQPLLPPRRGWLLGSIGFRYSNLEQDFAQTGVFAGGAAGTIDTFTSIDFDGYGPTIGIEGDFPMGHSDFSFYGRGLLAALVGEFHSRYTMYNSTTDVLLAHAVWSDDHIVPVIEYELGIAYTFPSQRVRLSLGYLTTWWTNIVSTPEFIDAVQADNYVDLDDSLAFEGVTGRAELRW